MSKPGSSNKKSLQELAEEQGVELLLPVLPTLHGDNKGSFVPVAVSNQLEKEGAGVFAFGCFKMSLNVEKQFGIPDVSTLTKLSWKPNVAWLQCNVFHNGEPLYQCPRRKLMELQEKAKSLGFYMKSGLEVEFQLLHKEAHKVAEGGDGMSSYQSPYLTMARADFIKDIVDVVTQLGWKPYQAEHEGVTGQYEINYEYSDALTAADRHSFFKFMVKEIARKHDCRATFMPLPFQNGVVGNGLHLNLSIWDPVKEVSLMPGESSTDDSSGLSPIAEHFLAGILAHAEALTAMLCPNVNSYKRLHETLFVQMAGPGRISWGRKSRFPMIRLPNNERAEVRCADASASPYLALSALLAAGIDGVENEMPLSKSLQMEEDQFLAKPDLSHLKTFPKTLMQACDHLAKDEGLKKQLGADFVDAFVGVKTYHWDEYMKELSQFEIKMVDDY